MRTVISGQNVSAKVYKFYNKFKHRSKFGAGLITWFHLDLLALHSRALKHCLLFYFRTRWKCVLGRMSSRAYGSPCVTSMQWWQRGGSLDLKDGTDRIPLTLETLPFLSMSSTTTWKPILR